MPRPRSLDEIKCREICALVAAGCALRQAARYVQCSPSTIHREAQRDPQFLEALRRAEMAAQLSPLHAMQQAVATHWRAAAWYLERTDPERFARPDARAFGPRQVRALKGDVTRIIQQEVMDPLAYERIAKRVKAAFDYAMHKAWDQRRSQSELRRAIELFERKERDSLLMDGWDQGPAHRSLNEPTAPDHKNDVDSPDAILAEFCGKAAKEITRKLADHQPKPTQNERVLR
jgi:hypothetical protein